MIELPLIELREERQALIAFMSRPFCRDADFKRTKETVTSFVNRMGTKKVLDCLAVIKAWTIRDKRLRQIENQDFATSNNTKSLFWKLSTTSLLEMVSLRRTRFAWPMHTWTSNQTMMDHDNDISPSVGDRKMTSRAIEPSKGINPRSQSHPLPVASLVRLIWMVKQGTIWAKLNSKYTADNNAETNERILICWATSETTKIATIKTI